MIIQELFGFQNHKEVQQPFLKQVLVKKMLDIVRMYLTALLYYMLLIIVEKFYVMDICGFCFLLCVPAIFVN